MTLILLNYYLLYLEAYYVYFESLNPSQSALGPFSALNYGYKRGLSPFPALRPLQGDLPQW